MKYISLLCLLVLPAIILTFNSNLFVRCEEDELEDEVVDDEGSEYDQVGGGDVVGTGSEEGSEDNPSGPLESSPNADIVMLFTKPTFQVGQESQLELPAGKVVELLVGVTNTGVDELILESLDASFRYPMDFAFHIQNFSQVWYGRTVKPNHQATLAYSFMPAEPFAGRPFGLSVNLNYRDGSGNNFAQSIYNKTVNVVEVSSGLDGETFFLYVFLVAGLVLALVGGQAALAQLQRKHSQRHTGARHTLETGTTRKDVDYDWLPKELLTQINKKSPKAVKQQSPKQSPRQKKNKSD